MKRILAALAAALLLAACADAPAGNGPIAAPSPAPTDAPAPAAPPELLAGHFVPMEGDALRYDEIRPVAVLTSDPARAMRGYFTVCADGKWGLLRGDGRELLPCLAAAPVTWCGSHWHWASGLPPEAEEGYTALLRSNGDGEVGGDHDGGGRQFFYDLDTGTPAVLPGQLIEPRAVRPADAVGYGTLLPVYPARIVGGGGDPGFPGEAEGDWFFADIATGTMVRAATPRTVTAAGWFGDEALAPVQLDGGGWCYVDRSGDLRTGDIYAPIYSTDSHWDDGLGQVVLDAFKLAAPLLNGFAAVQRADTGSWGLLDSDGTEIIPAENAGCAWNGQHLYLRPAGQDTWQGYTLYDPDAPILPATPAEPAVPEGFAPIEGVKLPWDEIRPAVQDGIEPRGLVSGYFTVCREGKWGLMRADGAEVLPCTSDQPVYRCNMGHWVCFGIDWDEWEAVDARLRQNGDGSLEPGHGGLYGQFFFDDTQNAPCLYSGMDGSSNVSRLEDIPFDDSGWCAANPWWPQGRRRADTLFPVTACHVLDDEFRTLSEPAGGWYYIDGGSGRPVYIDTAAMVTAAGWFYDEALAPVQLDYGNWAYAAPDGQLATDAVYAATCGGRCTYNRTLAPWALDGPQQAALLQNGFAAVQRADTGGWGLLDENGVEVIPAVYAGCAWDGTTLWLRASKDSSWGGYTLAQ